jgi:hypothetical protein
MWLRMIGAVMGSLCVPVAVWAQEGLIFRASLLGGAGEGATGIVLGDFDGDGLVEVATSHSDSGSIVINFLFRDEPVEFTQVQSVPAGSVPSGLLTGLFDDDEILDFVVANVNEGTIRFIRGATQGEFDFSFDPPGVPIPVGDSPVGLASTDLNGDGILDVVVANRGSTDDAVGEVAVLRGEGDGTFSVASVLTTQIGTVGVAIGRIDADQELDVVAVNSGANTVSTFFGRGGFAFDIGPNVMTGAAPLAVALGDLNGDGVLDVVTADSNADTVSVLLSNRNRTFAPRVAYPVGTNPTAIAATDVNGDGHADVVVTNKRSSDVSVLYGDGSGRLPRVRHFVVDEEPVVVALGDLAGGGRVDIVTANAAPMTIAALFNLGETLGETFQGVEDLRTGNEPHGLAAGDINNDGFPDLVAVHRSGEVVGLHAGPDGFTSDELILNLSSGLDLALVDFNQDGRLDLAVLDDQSRSVAIAFGLGLGNFSGVVQNLVTGDQPTAMTAADVDGDGRLDVAVVSIGPPGQVAVFRQQADGSFGARQTTQIPCTLPDPECLTPVPVAMAAADFNCDGNDDLLVANSLSSTVAVMVSSGNGTFTVQNQLSEGLVGRGPNALAIADFNRDGQPDFAVGSRIVTGTGEAVRVLFGNTSPCNATFRTSGEPQYRFGDNLISALVARDIAGNSLVDIVGAYQVLNSVQIFPATTVNAQMLTEFVSRQVANVSRMPLDIVAADFNGDGSYDVATANGDLNASNLSVVTNALVSDVLRGDGNGDGKVTAADVTMLVREIADGDGDQVEDIVLRNPQSQRGVDANGDGRVDRQDVLAHVVRIFRER